MFPGEGKPTKLAPIPRPAPDLALTPRLGLNKSNKLNVAAAMNPIKATSSNVIFLFGRRNAAVDTTNPSMMYLSTRMNTSMKSNECCIIFIYMDIFYFDIYLKIIQ